MEPKAPPIRPFHVRRSLVLLASLMTGVAVVPFPRAPASASCAAPYLKVADQAVLRRDSTETVEGRAFTDGGCQDSMSCTESLGCSSCEYADPPATPMKDVALRLAQRDRIWILDIADSGSAEDNRLGWVSWTFELPDGVKPGHARLLSERAIPVRVVIR